MTDWIDRILKQSAEIEHHDPNRESAEHFGMRMFERLIKACERGAGEVARDPRQQEGREM